ncbi:MAG: hypothetical protein ACE5JI_09665 [Acidobacteriota bacterium]
MSKLHLWLVCWASVAALAGCSDTRSEEDVQGLEVTDVVAYWSVRGKAGESYQIYPVARFRVRNGNQRDVNYMQAMAVFRRPSAPEESWGSAYLYSITEGPLAPGELSPVLTLRCDSNYISKDPPQKMLENPEWEHVWVELFLKAGSSAWRPAHKMEVPKRLGAPGVEKFLRPPGGAETPAEDARVDQSSGG